jgi:ATP phosphoribosyltransferase
VEIDVLFESSAYLIGHPLSYRLNAGGVNELIGKLREQVLTTV